MSRKDYVKVAALLAGELALAEHSLRGDSDAERRLGRARRDTVVRIALSLGDLFKQDNPAFDRKRFHAAIGMEDHGQGFFKVGPPSMRGIRAD